MGIYMNSRFELRLKVIAKTKFHAPVVEVMDTFETVVLGINEFAPRNWTSADAVKLTELILQRVRQE